MDIYENDGKKHKSGSSRIKAERDSVVQELRRNSWIVNVGKYNNIDGSGEIFWYEAEKER